MIDKSQLKVGTVIRFGNVDEILPLFEEEFNNYQEYARALASEVHTIKWVKKFYFGIDHNAFEDYWFPIESIKEIISQPVDWDDQGNVDVTTKVTNTVIFEQDQIIYPTFTINEEQLENSKYSVDITEFTIRPKGEPTFHELATVIKIDDEAAGCFIRVQQFGDTSVRNGEIAFDIEEWQVIKDTIDKAVAIAEKINGEKK